jgi:hypothetical protein
MSSFAGESLIIIFLFKIFFTSLLNFNIQLNAKTLNLMWKTVVIRIVVDYIIESIWEVNGRLFIARESGCPDRHKTDP